MQRLILTICLLIASLATASADGFGCRWMSHPQPDDTAHVWFRRTFVSTAGHQKTAVRALTAYIHVATTGRFMLYVNGRNVSTALYMPNRADGDTSAVAFTFDVQRFLRPDTNTVALLYCPSMRTRRQISVSIFGITADSSRYAFNGTDGWLCRHADTWLTHDGGEAMNRNTYPYRWTDTKQPLALWLAAEETHTPTPPHPLTISPQQPLNAFNPEGNAVRILRITRPLFTEQTARSLTAHLIPGFHGIVRVTLRGCKRGERIRIGSLLYTCTGEMDEQAFMRFTTTTQTAITISGDRHFRPEQVQEVEAISL